MSDIALFDMDNSLADYEGALVRDLASLSNPNEPKIDRGNIWNRQEPHILKRMRLIKSQPGWWFNLEPIKLGLDVLEICKNLGYEIHILTKGPKKHSRAWAEKVEWCQKYLGTCVDVHITSDKGMVYGKVLYDDFPEYIQDWLKYRPRGLGIIPINDGNKNDPILSHPNVIPFDGNMDRVIRALTIAKNRRYGENLKI